MAPLINFELYSPKFRFNNIICITLTLRMFYLKHVLLPVLSNKNIVLSTTSLVYITSCSAVRGICIRYAMFTVYL